MTLPAVCADCGDTFDRDTTDTGTCRECKPVRPDDRPCSTRRGYDWRWRKLSQRARELQPFCTDCGTPEDLTTDHTPQAWQRIRAGKVIRLADVDVVCRRCNSDRGAARGERPTDRHTRGTLHMMTDRCPVCRATITPTTTGNVAKHRDMIGKLCPMSGQPFPAA